MMTFANPVSMRPGGRTAARCGALVALVLAAGCTLELQNRQAAEELARQSRPPGSVYAGWRVFQDRCAACHGPDAAGTPGAPDLMPTMRQTGPRGFVDLVLRRYDWLSPAGRAAAGGAARDTLIDDIVQRRDQPLSMPTWEGEPRVNAHIVDLYAYLSARAEGTQGPGRPER